MKHFEKMGEPANRVTGTKADITLFVVTVYPSHSTALHVASIGLVISGDAVYNNTHPYLAECDENARDEWLRALDKIEALRPKAVVAGHGVLDPDSSPRHIEATRNYIHDFNATVSGTSTALDLYEKVLALHPNRVNPGSLWASAKAAKGNAKASA
jgi:glyoxylase-like metal-dependent hydrolase (beta-lactamase superfamily II)